MPYTLLTRIRLLCHGVKVGKRFAVRGWIHLHISPKAKVVLGDDVMITSGFSGNPTACSARTGIHCRRGAELVVGNNSGIFGTTIICYKSVNIGQNVLIAGGTHIYDSDFHSLDPKLRWSDNDNVPGNGVVIGDGSWIGSRCIILKGVAIGEQAVIGAGSVVTGNVPPRQVWAGNPARFIKEI